MSTRITGAAKAETPFGPLAGRTEVHLDDCGTDSVRIAFMCGPTPVSITMADSNYLAFVRECIARASDLNRAALTAELADALGVAS